MKKISTLALMAFFFCLSSMAQVVLGDINFSLGEGKKINPTTGKITVTFPNVTGVADPTATSFVLAGAFNESDFDGVEGTFASGVTFDLAEFELQPATDYTLKITSVKVDGAEVAAEGGYSLNFKTRGAERKMSWTFQLDQESKDKIVADDGNDPAFNESNGGSFWKCIKADERHYIHQSLKNSEIMLDANSVLPMSEDLTFTAGMDKMFIGDVEGKFKGMLVFNATNLLMTIPDCKVGDVNIFNGVNATKGNASKQTCIFTANSAAIAPDGIESSRGVNDSIWVTSDGNYRFESQVDGDITFTFSNFRMRSIEITEAQEKLPRNYSIVAAYTADDQTTILKELVGKTEGTTGSTIKANYPYWLTDANNIAYTYGTKGTPFEAVFDLKNGEGDTTFVINYAKTAYEGVAYLSEGEDIPGAVLCTNGNAVIRSSMAKAGYVAEDTKLVTLQPGTYKIRAVIFDANKTPGYICTLTKGAGDENEIYLSATATNFDEKESDLLTITEATDITLKAGGSETTGLDVIMIYASDDAPEDPDGIADVKANTQDATTRKMMKNGQILIKTAAGTFNAIGVQVK